MQKKEMHMKHLFAMLGLWTVVMGFTGCVVKEREYDHHHWDHHHEHVYLEDEPVVEEKVVVH